jgi:ATP-dependent Clp protease ATP-binding subunit ClpX
VGLEDLIERRICEKKMGFGAEMKGKADKGVGELLKDVATEDLLKYGLIPEFLGRIPVIATLGELDQAALARILTEPKNALVKQYQRLFEMERVKLEFTPGALDAVASEAIRRKAGARGLRSILESVMLDIMYDVPSKENAREIHIDEDVIFRRKTPLVVYDNEKKAETA